jgi:hypothetical protein
MRTLQRFVVAVALSGLIGANVAAGEEMTEAHEPAPAAALGAAALNVLFVPLRLAVTVLFAELGGITGLLTGGDEQAAKDVWGLVGGRNFLTPAFVQGKEPMHLESYHRVPTPSRSQSMGFPFEPAVPGGRYAD